MDSALISLGIILAMVALAPLLSAALARWVKVPVVVSEMALGILVGPGALGLVGPNETIAFLGWLGVVLLFFIAGYETDYSSLRGRPIAIGSIAWLVCLGLGVAAGTLVATFFPMEVATSTLVSGVFIGAALVSTGLGTILPMMRDAGEVDTRVGRAVVSSGVVGQFMPLIALAVLVGQHQPFTALWKHLVFFAAIIAAVLAVRRGLPTFLARAQTATMDSGGQVGARLQLLICLGIVLLGLFLGVDRLIGAFGAGIVVRTLWGRPRDAEQLAERGILERKLRSIAFGIFVPVFFVYAGVTFDLPGLIRQPLAFALIPVFLVLLLVVRGLPGSVTLPKGASIPERAATALLVGTGLAAVIVMAELGLVAGAISSVVAAALMGAAKLSALVFPTVALALARRAHFHRLGD